MTPLTWIATPLAPVTLWVESREMKGYEAQGFVLAEYIPVPSGFVGCCFGKVKIIKKGSECIHVWSPELSALHAAVGTAYDVGREGLSYGRVWQEYGHAHSWLMNEGKYHESLIYVEKYADEVVEIPQARIVEALKAHAATLRGQVADRVREWAREIEAWRYKGHAQIDAQASIIGTPLAKH